MKKDLKDEPVFKDGDETLQQRAYALANTVKHYGSDIFADRHAETDTIPLWLTNTGLKTRTVEVTYLELATLVSEVATAAFELQDPLSFGNPDDARSSSGQPAWHVVPGFKLRSAGSAAQHERLASQATLNKGSSSKHDDWCQRA